MSVLVPLGCAVAGPVSPDGLSRRPAVPWVMCMGRAWLGRIRGNLNALGYPAGPPPSVRLVVCRDCEWSGRCRGSVSARVDLPGPPSRSVQEWVELWTVLGQAGSEALECPGVSWPTCRPRMMWALDCDGPGPVRARVSGPGEPACRPRMIE